MRNVIFLVVTLACFAVVSAAPPLSAAFGMLIYQCNKETGAAVDEKIWEKIYEDLEYTPQTGSFMLCLYKMLGAFNANGELNVEKLNDSFKLIVTNDEERKAEVEKCSERKPTPEETAFYFGRCLDQFLEVHKPPPHPPQN